MEQNEIKIICICIVIMYFCVPLITALVIPIPLLQSAGGFAKPTLPTSLTSSSFFRTFTYILLGVSSRDHGYTRLSIVLFRQKKSLQVHKE